MGCKRESEKWHYTYRRVVCIGGRKLKVGDRELGLFGAEKRGTQLHIYRRTHLSTSVSFVVCVA